MTMTSTTTSTPRGTGRAGRGLGVLGTPLPWLAALLVAYLVVPLGAFAARLAGTPHAQLSAPGLGAALRTSLSTASIATAVIAVLGVPLAYLLAHGRGRIAALVGVLVQLPLALPPLMSGVLLLYVVGPYSRVGQWFDGALTDDAVGVILAQVFVAAPFLVISARSAFARVALPAAAPGIRAGLLLAWLRAFGEFGATVVLAYHPYSLPVFTYVQFGSTGLDATVLPVAAALAAAFVVLALVGLLARGAASRVAGVRRGRTVVPAPRPPAPAADAPLAFDLRASLGGFQLRAAHQQADGRQGHARHLAVMGPSGAGKSLVVRLIAGLASLDAGGVRLADTDLTALRPERRGIGYLPQDPSLLPGLTVWRQLTFGVGTDPAVAAYWLHKLGLSGLEQRRPDQLSGGQRRRVALARALAREPRLLLLDEPFTGLDTPVRDELRRELRRLQRETGLTTVLVTHDPDEAALLADEVLLLIDGEVAQAGPQREVFAHPASPAAARLLGARNVTPGRLASPTELVSAGVRLDLDPTNPVDLPAGTPVSWSIRPEDVRLDAGSTDARIVDAVHLGAVTELLLAVRGEAGDDAFDLVAVSAGTDAAQHRIGATCRIDLPATLMTVWVER
jgi:ABC-type sulfate/molybdate transport systems ATPase subunit/ABC-type sulfate transport system permease component